MKSALILFAITHIEIWFNWIKLNFFGTDSIKENGLTYMIYIPLEISMIKTSVSQY